MSALLAAGADRNVPTPYGFTRPALLAAGADKNAADQYPLMSAVKTADGTSLVIEELLSSSFDQRKEG